MTGTATSGDGKLSGQVTWDETNHGTIKWSDNTTTTFTVWPTT